MYFCKIKQEVSPINYMKKKKINKNGYIEGLQAVILLTELN